VPNEYGKRKKQGKVQRMTSRGISTSAGSARSTDSKSENASARVLALLGGYNYRQAAARHLEIEALRAQLGLRGPLTISDLMALQNQS
jgi:hypothetical protein